MCMYVITRCTYLSILQFLAHENYSLSHFITNWYGSHSFLKRKEEEKEKKRKKYISMYLRMYVYECMCVYCAGQN